MLETTKLIHLFKTLILILSDRNTWKNVFEETKLYVTEYRKVTKNLILDASEKKSLIIFITGIPFLLTLTYLLKMRYKANIMSILLEEKIPAVSFVCENIDWNTFNKTRAKKLIKSAINIENLDLKANQLVVKIEKKRDVLQKKYYGGFFFKNITVPYILNEDNIFFNPSTIKLHNKQYALLGREILNLKSKNNFELWVNFILPSSSQYVDNLDELPKKLDKNNLDDSYLAIWDPFLPNKAPILIKRTKLSTHHNTLKTNQIGAVVKNNMTNEMVIFEEKEDRDPFYLVGAFSAPTKVNTYLEKNQNQELEKKIVSKNQKKIKYLEKVKLLQNYYKENCHRNYFFPLNIDLTDKTKFYENFEEFENRKLNSYNDTKELLSEIAKCKKLKPNHIFPKHLMSSFRYPDMSAEEIINLYCKRISQNLFLQNQKNYQLLKIKLPETQNIGLELENLNKLSRIVKLPEIEIELKFKNNIGDYYPNIIVTINPKTNDIQLKNEKEVIKKLEQILSYQSRITSKKINFFRFNDKLKEQENFNDDTFYDGNYINDQNVKESHNKYQKLPIRKDKPHLYNFKPKHTLSLSLRQEMYLKNADKNVLKECEKDKNYAKTRVLYIKKPSKQEIIFPLNFTTNINLVDFLKLKRDIINEFSTNINKSSENNDGEKNLTGTEYKKNSSSYLNAKNETNARKIFSIFSKNFYEINEPFTVYFWLATTQVVFGFFVLQICINQYSTYGKEFISYLKDATSKNQSQESKKQTEEVFELLELVLNLLCEQLGFISNFLYEQLELELISNDNKIRFFRKTRKRFKDIVNIDKILLELGDIVWFLRGASLNPQFSSTAQKNLLLTGPPGTGKTLLAQAIAGEAEVPIVILSGSLLTSPENLSSNSEIEKLFAKARSYARRYGACIIFIDEIDSFGAKRDNLVQNLDNQTEDLFDLIYKNLSTEILKKNTKSKNQYNLFFDEIKDLSYMTKYEDTRKEIETNQEISVLQKVTNKEQLKTKQLSTLLQFLSELDGIQKDNGIVVIGATNRFNTLDPALLRPGRFNRVLNMGLPTKEKRIDILKFYSKNCGIDANLNKNWDYLGNRTRGLNNADLAAIMNESAIKAITNETTHSVKTIETGINIVTSSKTGKVRKNRRNNRFSANKFAYHESGKALLYSLISQSNEFPIIKSNGVFVLWPTIKNKKNQEETADFSIYSEQKISRLEFELKLLLMLSGKAAEMLLLSTDIKNRRKESQNLYKQWESDLGKNEIKNACYLAKLMVGKWYLYSKTNLFRKSQQLFTLQNNKVFIDPYELELSSFKALATDLQLNNKLYQSTYLRKYQTKLITFDKKIEVINDLSFLYNQFGDWYRLYLPIAEENERNDEWLPPDKYYHRNNRLKNVHNSVFEDTFFHSIPMFISLFLERIAFYLILKKIKNYIIYFPDLEKIELRSTSELNYLVLYLLLDQMNQIIIINQIYELINSLSKPFKDYFVEIFTTFSILGLVINNIEVLYSFFYYILETIKESFVFILTSSFFNHFILEKQFLDNLDETYGFNIKDNFMNANASIAGLKLMPHAHFIFFNLTMNLEICSSSYNWIVFKWTKIKTLTTLITNWNTRFYKLNFRFFNFEVYLNLEIVLSALILDELKKSMKNAQIDFLKLNTNTSFLFVIIFMSLKILTEAISNLQNFISNLDKKYSITWNQLYKIEEDYLFHSLIMISFNTTFSLLDERRELLDLISEKLLRHGLIRDFELKELTKNFGESELNFLAEKLDNRLEKNQKLTSHNSIHLQKKIMENYWGNLSKRKISRYFEFEPITPRNF